MILLKYGSLGPDVRKLQRMLNFEVAVYPLLIVDGIFGKKTEARVKEYQTAHQLQIDGIVGDLTMKALIAPILRKTLLPEYAK